MQLVIPRSRSTDGGSPLGNARGSSWRCAGNSTASGRWIHMTIESDTDSRAELLDWEKLDNLSLRVTLTVDCCLLTVDSGRTINPIKSHQMRMGKISRNHRAGRINEDFWSDRW